MLVLSVNILKQLQENTVFLDKQTPPENKAKVKEIFMAIEEQAGDKIKLGRLLGKSEAATGVFAQQMDSAIKEFAVADKYTEVALDHELSLLMAIHDEKALVGGESFDKNIISHVSLILSCLNSQILYY